MENPSTSHEFNDPVSGGREQAPKTNLFASIVLTALISAVVFGAVGFYFGKRSTHVASTVPSENTTMEADTQALAAPTPKTPNSPTLRAITELIADAQFVPLDHQAMWWVSDDMWSILIENSDAFGLVKTNAYSELQDPASQTSKLVDAISSHFIARGYSQNQRNSSSSFTDDTYYDFIRGFENSTEKCLLTVSADTSSYQNENGQMVADPNVVITCASLSSVDASYDQQIPFLKALNNRKVILKVQAETDSAAKASVNWRRTGAYVLFSKIDGNWKVIYEGQDQPSCQVLEQYHFPKEVHDACY